MNKTLLDQEYLALFSWSTEAGTPVHYGLQLSHSFEDDEHFISIPLTATAPTATNIAPAGTSTALPKSVYESYQPSSSPLNYERAKASRLNFVSQISKPNCEPARPLSQSSTHPGNISDAFTSAAGTTSVSAPDRVPSPKRRRTGKTEEHPIFPILEEELLQDLKGTTAARSRLMTDEERALMLHKRRLRNRASAARSREKQRSAIQRLSEQVEGLNSTIHKLRRDSATQQAEIRRLREQNNALRAAVSVRSDVSNTFRSQS